MKPDLRLGELAEPNTGARLQCESDSLVPTHGGRRFPIHADWIDFLPERDGEGAQVMTALMHLPAVSSAYERVVRPSVDGIRVGQRVDWRREAAWAAEALCETRGVVADLACGSGFVGIRAAQEAAFEHLYCVDRAEPLLAHCVRRLEVTPPRCTVTLLRADTRALPLASRVLDAAHIRIGPSLWRGFDSLVHELARVIKPGGQLLASAAVGGGDLRGLAARMIVARTAGISMPSPARVEMVCETAGFAGVEVNHDSGVMTLRMSRT
ncbi:MAG: class I SAM-dependent methyltransferase [Nannocystaceae bacterium]